jgi:tol-pal system protein YbgF
VRRLARAAQGLVAGVLVSACATGADISASVREQELRDLRTEVAALRAALELGRSDGDRVAATLDRRVSQHARESAARIEALVAALAPLSATLADLATRVEGLQRRADEDAALARAEERGIAATLDALARHLTTLTERVAGVDARIASIQQELAARATATPRARVPGGDLTAAPPSDQPSDPAASPRPAERPPVTVSPSDTVSAPTRVPAERPIPRRGAGASRAQEIYDSAYLDFSRGRYAVAIGGFGELLRRFPDDPLAGNAQYWIGEAHWGLARSYDQSRQVEQAADARRKAVEALAKVAERYRHSDKVPVALYRQALILLELGETEQARQRLQHVVDTFPQAAESRLAREQLSREPE